MALVVLIEKPALFDEFVEPDMRRWWRNRCKKHVRDGETFIEVGGSVRFNVYEGIKRLKSFGVQARAAYRSLL